MSVVQLAYQLAVPLDQTPAATPFETGADLLRLLSLTADLEQHGESKPREVDWRLEELGGNAVSLHSISEPDLAVRAALSVVNGFAQAEEREMLPRSWSLAAGKRAHRVAARLGDTPETGLRLVVAGSAEAEARVTRAAARHLRVATRLQLGSYGSVVGVLGRVTAHGQRRTASLWSDVDGRRVEVRFGPQHVEDMRQAWAQAHVEVSGLLHENAAGQTLLINADSMQILDGEQVLLSQALPLGAYPGLTGGLETLEYLRLMRGDDS